MKTADLDKKICSHIIATRRQYDHPDMVRHYENFFRIISQTMNGYDQKAGFINSYSIRRTPERLTAEGHQYIVYDQYMGQTLNMLNRFFFQKKEPVAIFAYAHKLAGEWLISHRRFTHAFMAGQVYRQNFEKLKSSGHNDMKRAVFTSTQEYFVISHEAYHVLADTVPSIRSSANDSIDQYFDNYQKKTKIAVHFGALPQLSTFQKIARPFLKKHEVKAIENSNLGEMISRHRAQVSYALMHDSNLRSELIADHYAVSSTVSTMCIMYGIDISEALRAIFLCGMHLRSIRYLEAACVECFLKESDEPKGDYLDINVFNQESILSLTIRSHYLIHRCASVYDAYTNGEIDKVINMFTNSFKPSLIMTKDQFAEDLIRIQSEYYENFLDHWNSAIGNMLLRRYLPKETERFERENIDLRETFHQLRAAESMPRSEIELELGTLFNAFELHDPQLSVFRPV